MKTGYCHALGTQIFDPEGRPIVFRGVGIGGWLLIEGYMINSYGTIDRPRRLQAHIAHTVDAVYAEQFMKTWRQRFFTAEDVRFIAEQGFNMIRIALDYQVFFTPSETASSLEVIDGAFNLLDTVIQWCKTAGVYVILDLHAAPGGQTGTNIDNSMADHPDLFTHALYQDQTVFIWETLARRYRDEPIIAAYDLLNEPLPSWFSRYNNQLMPLYERIINAIRALDSHHMITLEGLHWSTDWSCFERLMDDNILLQFHKYWNAPDQESIKTYLADGERHGAPIMMGEGGENNLAWLTAAFKLYTQNAVSFVFWAYKKMTAHNALMSFSEPDNWAAFLEGSLSEVASKAVLEALLENIRFERCQAQEDVAQALLHRVPFTCPAYAYDFYGEGVSFGRLKHRSSSLRRGDGLTIFDAKGHLVEPVFNHMKGEDPSPEQTLYLWLKPGEWVTYTFHLERTAAPARIHIESIGPLHAKVSINDIPHTHHAGQLSCLTAQQQNILRIEAIEPIVLANIVFRLDR